MTPAQRKRFLPDNYLQVLQFVTHDLDGVCVDNWKTLQKVAAHMGWEPKMVSGVLGILTKEGYLKRVGSQKGYGYHKWVVVKPGEAAA